MKLNNIISIFFVAMALLFTTNSCDITEVPNPNGPSLEQLENNATLADLRLLGSGLESVLREDMEFYYTTVSIVGREYYDLTGIDPRYTGELVAGIGADQKLDNNGFLTTRSFAARYRAVRTAEVFLKAVQNSSAGLTAGETDALLGFAKTMKAYALLLAANRQFDCGVRLDVADPDNRGPFTSSYREALDGIRAILDEAAGNLTSAGASDFVFNLSSGFAGFDTPATFLMFNQALAARVALYAGESAGTVNKYVGDSFMDPDGDMNMGAYHAFGTGGNDIRNPLFFVPNQELFTLNPAYEGDVGDPRLDAKTTALDPNIVDVPFVFDNLQGSVQVTMFASDTDPFPIIRNEELLLIHAEANIDSDNAGALESVNKVRGFYGLAPLAGPLTPDQLLEERRLSLFGEGHRWIDMRRHNRLNDLPIDRPGDKIFDAFPRPETENEPCG